mmetsp:Transcript_35269/g.76103  ORF Transcript_35269/g.76103 Transcript_35269/m.76103 type:complete len:212 (-) Transcript_35269:346-981(-)
MRNYEGLQQFNNGRHVVYSTHHCTPEFRRKNLSSGESWVEQHAVRFFHGCPPNLVSLAGEFSTLSSFSLPQVLGVLFLYVFEFIAEAPSQQQLRDTYCGLCHNRRQMLKGIAVLQFVGRKNFVLRDATPTFDNLRAKRDSRVPKETSFCSREFGGLSSHHDHCSSLKHPGLEELLRLCAASCHGDDIVIDPFQEISGHFCWRHDEQWPEAR